MTHRSFVLRSSLRISKQKRNLALYQITRTHWSHKIYCWWKNLHRCRLSVNHVMYCSADCCNSSASLVFPLRTVLVFLRRPVIRFTYQKEQPDPNTVSQRWVVQCELMRNEKYSYSEMDTELMSLKPDSTFPPLLSGQTTSSGYCFITFSLLMALSIRFSSSRQLYNIIIIIIDLIKYKEL